MTASHADRIRASRSTDRIAGLDSARLLAALATAWVHTMASSHTMRDTAEWGRFAVAYFNVCAGWFLISHLRGHPDEPIGVYAARRFVRLYIPFLVWSLLYQLGKHARFRLNGGTHPAPLGTEFFFIGTAQQMWYLPFLLLWSLTAYVCLRPIIAARRAEVPVGWTLIALGLLITMLPQPAWLNQLGLPPYFLERKWARISSLFWGLGAGLVAPPRVRLARIPAWAVPAGIAALLACIAGWTVFGHHSLLQNAGGVALVAIGLGLWPGEFRRVTARLGLLGYGIFLSHTVFIETGRAALAWARWPESSAADIGIWLSSVLLAAALTALVNRSRWTAWLLPI